MSKSFIKIPKSTTERDTPVVIHNVEVVLPIADERLTEIKIETAKDDVKKETRQFIDNEFKIKDA